jgi:hypothetical protein
MSSAIRAKFEVRARDHGVYQIRDWGIGIDMDTGFMSSEAFLETADTFPVVPGAIKAYHRHSSS